MIHVYDAVTRKAADMMVERGLADVGFQYVGIDDCWMRLTQELFEQRQMWTVKKHLSYDHIATSTISPIGDAVGKILPNGKFPDMKAMTDYIQSHGLEAGILCIGLKRSNQPVVSRIFGTCRLFQIR